MYKVSLPVGNCIELKSDEWLNLLFYFFSTFIFHPPLLQGNQGDTHHSKVVSLQGVGVEVSWNCN